MKVCRPWRCWRLIGLKEENIDTAAPAVKGTLGGLLIVAMLFPFTNTIVWAQGNDAAGQWQSWRVARNGMVNQVQKLTTQPVESCQCDSWKQLHSQQGGRTIFSDLTIRRRLGVGVLVGLFFSVPGMLISANSGSAFCEDEAYCGFTTGFIVSSIGFTTGSALGVYPSRKGEPRGSLPVMLVASMTTHMIVWRVAELVGLRYTLPLVAIAPALAAIMAFEKTKRYENVEVGALISRDPVGWHLNLPMPRIGLERTPQEVAARWYLQLNLLRMRF